MAAALSRDVSRSSHNVVCRKEDETDPFRPELNYYVATTGKSIATHWFGGMTLPAPTIFE
jgi:hypothetical protein